MHHCTQWNLLLSRCMQRCFIRLPWCTELLRIKLYETAWICLWSWLAGDWTARLQCLAQLLVNKISWTQRLLFLNKHHQHCTILQEALPKVTIPSFQWRRTFPIRQSQLGFLRCMLNHGKDDLWYRNSPRRLKKKARNKFSLRPWAVMKWKVYQGAWCSFWVLYILQIWVCRS